MLGIRGWYKVKDFFRGIKPGIGNIIEWFTVIYKDRWWDHSFLYRILSFKLRQIERNFRGRGVAVHTEKELRKIKTCYLLLDRLINDDYVSYKRGDNIRKSHEKEERMINQDLDLLFKIMRKQIRVWWD